MDYRKFYRMFFFRMGTAMAAILPVAVMAQEDYVPHPQFISTAEPVVRVEWIYRASERKVIDFYHVVEFIPLGQERFRTTTVHLELYRNNDLVKDFLFPVGTGMRNAIRIPAPLTVRKNDRVYFIFTLKPESEDEEYVFNIFSPYRNDIADATPVKAGKVSTQLDQPQGKPASGEWKPESEIIIYSYERKRRLIEKPFLTLGQRQQSHQTKKEDTIELLGYLVLITAMFLVKDAL